MLATPAEVFQRYTNAWNRQDAAGIVATFAEGGTYTDPTTAGPLAGAAIRAYAQSLWDAFPDLSFETVSLTHNDQGLVSAEWLMKGTNTGPMMGLPPTGRSIALAGADFARIECGEISPSKIMRCKVVEFHSLGTVSDYIPDNVLGDSGSPRCPVTTYRPEDSSGCDRYGCQPPVHGTLNPDRHRDCANVIALADEVYDSPMSLPNLNIFLSQRC
jgi:steroid delta-isomerase-like uncharacterized protein